MILDVTLPICIRGSSQFCKLVKPISDFLASHFFSTLRTLGLYEPKDESSASQDEPKVASALHVASSACRGRDMNYELKDGILADI